MKPLSQHLTRWEVYNPDKKKRVILLSIHPDRAKHPLDWWRVTLEPGERKVIRHGAYSAELEDGTPNDVLLTVSGGNAIGQEIEHPNDLDKNMKNRNKRKLKIAR